MLKRLKMKARKCLSSNQRKRTLHRNKVKLANRRHTQFSVDQYNNEESSVNANNELENS